MIQEGASRNLGEPCQFREDGTDKPERQGGDQVAWWSDQSIVEA